MPNDSPPTSANARSGSPVQASSPVALRASGIIAFAIVLALLYVGRDVLIPLTLALMLSLLIAPLVRALRRIGLGQTPAVLAAVLMLALAVAATAVMLGTQVLRMAASLPQYQETIQQKLQNLDEMTVGRLNALTSEVSRFIDKHVPEAAPATPARSSGRALRTPAASPIPVEVHETRADPFRIIAKVLTSVWTPLETAGIVLVVLVFTLLEHEALRDRFIRIAGGTNIRLSTLALNDAGERLSRYFVSQFAVNLGVGVAIGLGLAGLGLPHAALWGALAGILRFVPYVGVWIAALFATVLAIAVTPGWALAVSTLGLFVLIEVIAGQVIEPQLFGHTTGLSPLSVVVAAIFWSSLWGPIGLILSTPLTLCLLVLGRHMKTLNFLDLLLGDVQALTLPQKFYQRALSGDSREILTVAKAFLKRDSLAAYCDRVLMPALHLAYLDLQIGAIGESQQSKIRDVVVTVVSALSGESPGRLHGRHRASVLDPSSSGQTLRQQREHLIGRWQGPVNVPPDSVIVCVSLGSIPDDLVAELLVRILRDHKIDARHFSVKDAVELPPEATPNSVAIVFLVSAFPGLERERCDAAAEYIRKLLPGVMLVNVFLPGMSGQVPDPAPLGKADHVVACLVDAVQFCLEQRQEHASAIQTANWR
jgi:predicted PurR-regulated permease PerM